MGVVAKNFARIHFISTSFTQSCPTLQSLPTALMQNGKVAATAWLDRKVVTAMSSNSQPTASGTVLRRVQDRSRVSVPCPQSILLYNNFMGGVVQLRGYYSCRYKSRKFYKYIFFFLLDVAITNAFILHKHFAVAPKVKKHNGISDEASS